MSSEKGRAYAFFGCKESKEDVERELPTARICAKVPSTLELSLIDGADKLKGDTQLLEIARMAHAAGLRYVLEGTNAKATNHQTAVDLDSVLNQAYHSPLYTDRELFRREIVYEDGGKYLFRE